MGSNKSLANGGWAGRFCFIVLSPEDVHKIRTGDVSGNPSIVGMLRPSRRKPDHALHFNFSERAWKTGVQPPALLLHRDPTYRSPEHPERDFGIIAVARVRGHMRSPDGGRPITVDKWTHVDPVPLHEVLDEIVDSRIAAGIWKSLIDITRPLTDRQCEALGPILRQRISGFDVNLQSARQSDEQVQQALDEERRGLAERRDRMATALRMFGVQNWSMAQPIHSDRPTVDLPPQLVRFEHELYEQDMLTDDSAVVPGWTGRRRPVGGWYEFENNGRRLLVKNINTLPKGEGVSGGDLLYIRERPATVVVVQYKRLKERKNRKKARDKDRAEQLTFDDGQRLHNQLRRMVKLASGITDDPLIPGIGDVYRLSNTAGFVKFVETIPFVPADDELLPGLYLPADHCLDLLDSQYPSGPPSSWTNFTVSRYIDSQTFIRLVSDGWVGSRSPASIELARSLRPDSVGDDATSAELTLAYEPEHSDDAQAENGGG
ncbi:hypothetical protein [Nocardia testacea]|uniref:Uncharacterized protein n=1 Tax=Nocardia testacea TaxID=248551 RepID=A0ABW7VRS5_9NOCA